MDNLAQAMSWNVELQHVQTAPQQQNFWRCRNIQRFAETPICPLGKLGTSRTNPWSTACLLQPCGRAGTPQSEPSAKQSAEEMLGARAGACALGFYSSNSNCRRNRKLPSGGSFSEPVAEGVMDTLLLSVGWCFRAWFGCCCSWLWPWNRGVLDWEHGHVCRSRHLVHGCQLRWQMTTGRLSTSPKCTWLIYFGRHRDVIASATQQRGRECLQWEGQGSPSALPWINLVRNAVKWSSGTMGQPFNPSGRSREHVMAQEGGEEAWQGSWEAAEQGAAPWDFPSQSAGTHLHGFYPLVFLVLAAKI